MSLQHLLAVVICKTFISACGKWQVKKPTPKAFVVRFSTPVDFTKEWGTRSLDLALYAPYSHVNVYSRERWDLILLEDVKYDAASKITIPQTDKGYTQGSTLWKPLVSPDTGWSGIVEDFLQANAYQLDTFVGNFYTLVDAPEFENEVACCSLPD